MTSSAKLLTPGPHHQSAIAPQVTTLNAEASAPKQSSQRGFDAWQDAREARRLSTIKRLWDLEQENNKITLNINFWRSAEGDAKLPDELETALAKVKSQMRTAQIDYVTCRELHDSAADKYRYLDLAKKSEMPRPSQWSHPTQKIQQPARLDTINYPASHAESEGLFYQVFATGASAYKYRVYHRSPAAKTLEWTLDVLPRSTISSSVSNPKAACAERFGPLQIGQKSTNVAILSFRDKHGNLHYAWPVHCLRV